MATPIRAQISWQVGSMLPRDRFTLTPYFNHTQVEPLSNTDWSGLAEDLATAIKAWEYAPTSNQLTVNLYNMNDAEPRRPKATALRLQNNSAEASVMREIALCLSFSTEKNVPRERGRLYLPYAKLAGGVPGPRPGAGDMTKALAFGDILKNLGGINVDWSIYSPTTGQTKSVYKMWVDDEWDVVRKRGLRPNTRQTSTIDE